MTVWLRVRRQGWSPGLTENGDIFQDGTHRSIRARGISGLLDDGEGFPSSSGVTALEVGS